MDLLLLTFNAKNWAWITAYAPCYVHSQQYVKSVQVDDMIKNFWRDFSCEIFMLEASPTKNYFVPK
jgi:hypothetical protein